MPKVVSVQVNGVGEILRMTKPADGRFGEEPCHVCGKRVTSLYSRFEGEHSTLFCGWRNVCGRKCYLILVERGDA